MAELVEHLFRLVYRNAELLSRLVLISKKL